MDKEMKAKIDEILKANSRRELSMDEMDKVSGGACYDVKDFKTEEDINYYVYTFIAGVEQNFGKDIAIDIVKSQFPSYDVIKYYGSANGDLDCLHNLLCQKFIDGSGVH